MKKAFSILVGIAFLVMFSIIIEASLGNTSDVFRVDTPTLTLK